MMDGKGLCGHKERMPSEGVAWMTQAGVHSQTPSFYSTTDPADQRPDNYISEEAGEDREPARI